MTNQQIIDTLSLTAKLMELHEENAFKIRSIQNAVFNLEKIADDLSKKTQQELEQTEGIGKGLASKIIELNTTNTTKELEALLKETPAGVVSMFSIKGIGPKKIRTLWKELNILDKEALLQACNDNKVSKLKGFGEKTQESIKQALLYSQEQQDKFLYAEVEAVSIEFEKELQKLFSPAQVSLSGEIRRHTETVETLQALVVSDNWNEFHKKLDASSMLSKDELSSGPYAWRGKENKSGAKVEIKMYPEKDFATQLFLHSSGKNHLTQAAPDGLNFIHFVKTKSFKNEQEIYQALELDYMEPELREGIGEVELAKEKKLPTLVTYKDLKGILHNHSTWSDGLHTLEEMATHCKSLGFEYFGIADHSKTAFYANGLDERRIKEQHKEIDELNKKLAPFKILKGIESDILNDGALDYSDEVLASFDYIVASVHSNLKMNKEKATERLLKAIQNPYTTILGHMTGRLLLQREGYPVDYPTIINACAEHKVIIELNAHPRRLDMDWRWIPYALEKGVKISINPDAHEKDGLLDMHYGVLAGRKGRLTPEMTFNTMGLSDIEEYLELKKKK